MDRLTGRLHDRLPKVIAFGQWIVAAADGVRINAVDAQPGDVICPDRQDRWLVEIASDERWDGSLTSRALPGARVQANLERICETMDAADALERPFDGWLECPPLALDLMREHRLLRRERQLLRDRGAVEHVCHQPRTYLRREVERSPTSRMRRLAPRAEQFLASHPEDWERRRLGTVLPRRVLASYIEEEWNTYENRMAVRLVDRLRVGLQDRVAELDDALGMLHELAGLAEFSDGINHRKWDRMCRLLGDAGDPKNGYLAMKATRDTLASLLMKCRSLEDSVLYTRIPRRATIGGPLRQTNVLTNDQRYSKVARLWRLYSSAAIERTPSDREVYRRRQIMTRHYDRFCALVLVWSLRDLGYDIVDGSVPTQGGCTEFQNAQDGAALLVQWDECGFRLHDEFERFLRITPVCHALSTEYDESDRERHIDVLMASSAARASDEPLVVLYPGTVVERRTLPSPASRRLASGSDRSPMHQRGAPRFIGVSPLEVDSVERVARVIRWWLREGLFCAFPPTVECNADAQELAQDLSGLVVATGPRTARLLRSPSLEQRQVMLSFEKRHVQRWRGARKGKTSPQPETLVDEESLGAAIRLLDRLGYCPVCGRVANQTNDIQAGVDGFVRATCEDCGTKWGVQRCGHCGERYTLILPGGTVKRRAEHGSEWIDLQYGRDVLASPCWHSYGDDVEFICPACGSCPKSGKPEHGACERCTCSA